MKYYNVYLVIILIIVLPSVIALKQGETTVIDIGGNDYAVYFNVGETAENIDFLITGFVEAEPLNNGQTILKQDEQSCYYISFLSTNSGLDLMVSECESVMDFQEAGESITIYPYTGQEFCISATLHSINSETILTNLNVPEECMIDVICGNGIIELNEECDDGNIENSDGCSITCSNEDTTKIQEKGVIIGEDCYMLLSEQNADGLNIEINLADDTFCNPPPDSNPNPNPTPNPGGGSGGGSGSMGGVPLTIPNKKSLPKVVIPKPSYETQTTQQELPQQSQQKVIKTETGAEIQQPGTINEKTFLKPMFISIGLILLIILIIGFIVYYFVYKPKSINSSPIAPKLPVEYEQQLRKYISINIRKGLSVDKIVYNLTKTGWKKEDIEKIMNKK